MPRPSIKSIHYGGTDGRTDPNYTKAGLLKRSLYDHMLTAYGKTNYSPKKTCPVILHKKLILALVLYTQGS